MKKNVFEYRDYKLYLNDFIKSQPRNGHGVQSKIATLLSCHSAYVTQVLKKDAHFSLEQAEILNPFLRHTNDEADFFILLVQSGRAGTQSLRERIDRQMKHILEKRQLLKKRFSGNVELKEVDQMTYYSHWYYCATHILTSIDKYQTIEALASRLSLSSERVVGILQFLESVGLIQVKAGKYKYCGNDFLFLGNDSPLLPRHHTNWRMYAISSLGNVENNDLHFSTVVSLSDKDVLKIKEKMITEIESTRKIIRDSPEEDIYCYNLDFFKVGY